MDATFRDEIRAKYPSLAKRAENGPKAAIRMFCNRPHYPDVTCVCGGTAIDPEKAMRDMYKRLEQMLRGELGPCPRAPKEER